MTFAHQSQSQVNHTISSSTSTISFEQHQRWEPGTTWKSALNNLRLLIQPFIFWCLIQTWLQVFPIPGLKRGFFKLMAYMNSFHTSSITSTQLNSA